MINKNNLTYKDFKIGQKVTCIKNDDFTEQHITIGKQYIIEDLDFHFPDSICVKCNNKKLSMFLNIKYFCDIKLIRKLKLEKLSKTIFK